jgi:predicted TIM-barrel fold metal-dependent hydrolase
MKKIDLEAHFYTRHLFDYLLKASHYPKALKINQLEEINVYFTENVNLFHTQDFIDALCNIETSRIEVMDKAGISTQVLSFSTPSIDELYPDVQSAIYLAIELNDIVCEAMKRHPTRFQGFAAIACNDVVAATTELERCMTQLKFSGWLTHSSFGKNDYLDAKKYWPLLEAAEQLNCPIYLHPTIPLMKEFTEYGFALAGPALGFQFDTALCLMRMIYAGVFNEFPNLKIILGHLGETLPMLMPDRIDYVYKNKGIAHNAQFIKTRPKLNKLPSEIIQDNVYMTTSGRFSKPTLDFTLEILGEDRIMFASDYPYENLMDSVEFIEQCQYSKQRLEKIFFKNAMLLGIKS